MSVSLSRQIRATLAGNTTLPLAELLLLVDDFVVECSASAEPEVLLFQFEEELQNIYDHVLDHSSPLQKEIFLAILYHLCAILPSTSVISTWFDLVLRPALRETKIPTIATNHAKELIILALTRTDPNYLEKVRDFRCRLLDLYLFDTYNEASEDDVLESVRLDKGERDNQMRWKENLEDILLKLGIARPHDLLVEVNRCFSTPSSRLQLLVFLDLLVSKPSFPPVAQTLANHPLMSTLLTCLLLDSCSTLCTVGVTLLVKLLAIFAVEAFEQLKLMLPNLLAIMAIFLLREEPLTTLHSDPPDELEDTTDAGVNLEPDVRTIVAFKIRPEFQWKCLEQTSKASLPPSPRRLFTLLYYLFPCNLLKFLRNPASHLVNNGIECPFVVGWEKVLDEGEIRTKSEELLRSHACHAPAFWRDDETELSNPTFWAQHDVPQIITEAWMLDMVNVTIATREKRSKLATVAPPLPIGQEEPADHPSDHTSYTLSGQQQSIHHIRAERASVATVTSFGDLEDVTLGHTILPINPTSGRLQISLQDMIVTSIALKSSLDIEIINPTSWPKNLFPKIVSSPTRAKSPPPSEVHSPETSDPPSHMSRALSSLQREVLLLRNEFNFELWLSRENIKHIGRIYQNAVLSKNAETERQGLYNKLRNLRAQVVQLERELKENKEQSSSVKSKYSDWNTELVQKLRDLREEKKSWTMEAAALRSTEKEVQARFAAQGKLLADATHEVFELRTQLKTVQPKIDRLRDYEREIDQHIKMQRLWDEDFKKFNEREEQMVLMKSQYRQMELRLDSYKKTQAEAEEALGSQRRQIRALEAQLALVKKTESSRQALDAEITRFAAERLAMKEANKKLRDDNAELREKEEELRATIEVLQETTNGTKGLVSAQATNSALLD